MIRNKKKRITTDNNTNNSITDDSKKAVKKMRNKTVEVDKEVVVKYEKKWNTTEHNITTCTN